jgi:hypothetical protein
MGKNTVVKNIKNKLITGDAVVYVKDNNMLTTKLKLHRNGDKMYVTSVVRGEKGKYIENATHAYSREDMKEDDAIDFVLDTLVSLEKDDFGLTPISPNSKEDVYKIIAID